jgi:hypothetical protein
MPNVKRFQTRSGGHVSIYVPWRNTPIEIMEGGTYETDDRRELEALKGSPEVVEVKEAARDPRKGR